MPLDVEALRDSFSLVAERAPDLTQRFYDVLFQRYPAAQSLFGRNTRPAQEKMLTEALVAVLERLESADWLRDTLHALGAKHSGYGVTDEMYDWVGDALLTTLAEVASEAWTPRVEAAWREAYGAIAGLMQEGARNAKRDDHIDTLATSAV